MAIGRQAVFLDRDGVLNQTVVRKNRAYAPVSLEDFHLVEGVEREVARLRACGLLCIVVTNQPEVARGALDLSTLERMHDRLRSSVGVDDIYVCLHDPAEGCICHKPQPGMLLAAAKKWGVNLKRSFVIGDRWRDIKAGQAVGCYTILLERPYSACTTADTHVGDLTGAVDLVLAHVGD